MVTCMDTCDYHLAIYIYIRVLQTNTCFWRRLFEADVEEEIILYHVNEKRGDVVTKQKEKLPKPNYF